MYLLFMLNITFTITMRERKKFDDGASLNNPERDFDPSSRNGGHYSIQTGHFSRGAFNKGSVRNMDVELVHVVRRRMRRTPRDGR